ncbi:hypothetical protein ES702_00700 [subsurface metagenome]
MSCYGNPRYWVNPYCFALNCPSVNDCKEERKKRRRELKNAS